ncbi:hypothetical protein RCL1_001282 [Eukaryota sp. TZLM3-RCL]
MSNIFVVRSGHSHILKLTDYDIKNYLSSDHTHVKSNKRFPTDFLAPELLLDPSKVTLHGDVFALGVIASILFTSQHPFVGDSFVDRIESIKANNRRSTDGNDVLLQNCIEACLSPTATSRASSQHLTRHPLLLEGLFVSSLLHSLHEKLSLTKFCRVLDEYNSNMPRSGDWLEVIPNKHNEWNSITACRNLHAHTKVINFRGKQFNAFSFYDKFYPYFILNLARFLHDLYSVHGSVDSNGPLCSPLYVYLGHKAFSPPPSTTSKPEPPTDRKPANFRSVPRNQPVKSQVCVSTPSHPPFDVNHDAIPEPSSTFARLPNVTPFHTSNNPTPVPVSSIIRDSCKINVSHIPHRVDQGQFLSYLHRTLDPLVYTEYNWTNKKKTSINLVMNSESDVDQALIKLGKLQWKKGKSCYKLVVNRVS